MCKSASKKKPERLAAVHFLYIIYRIRVRKLDDWSMYQIPV